VGSAAYGVDLTAEGVSEFAGRLAELGFLEAAGSAAAAPAPAAAAARTEATPPPSAVTPPPEAAATDMEDESDNPEAEWMTNEGAQTATFIPDPAMFENSPGEPTPVSPDLPRVEAELAAARNGAASRGGAASRDRDDVTPVPAARPAPSKLFDIPAPTAANKAPTREIPLPVVPAAARNPWLLRPRAPPSPTSPPPAGRRTSRTTCRPAVPRRHVRRRPRRRRRRWEPRRPSRRCRPPPLHRAPRTARARIPFRPPAPSAGNLRRPTPSR
jgi:hypothetical protein